MVELDSRRMEGSYEDESAYCAGWPCGCDGMAYWAPKLEEVGEEPLDDEAVLPDQPSSDEPELGGGDDEP